MKLIWILLCTALVWGCTDSENKEKTESKEEEKTTTVVERPENPEDLIEIKGNMYVEYYDAAKTKVKFEGNQDEEKKRHGRWVHYFQDGREASVTFYTHGIRNGFSSVRRPNGAMYYHGEYKDDKPVGIWKYYDEQGNLEREQDYDKL